MSTLQQQLRARNRQIQRQRGRGGGSFIDTGFQNALKIAQLFAELSRRAAEAANEAKLRAAEANIQVGTAQIVAQETDERRRIAQSLARHQGMLRVNAAFRGTAGSRSGQAAGLQAAGQAGQSAAVVTSNASFKEQALINRNIVDLDDPGLAAIEGGLRGFSIGQQIQAGLDQLAQTRVIPIRGGGDPRFGGTPFLGGQTIFQAPSLDFGKIFASEQIDFNELFGGIF